MAETGKGDWLKEYFEGDWLFERNISSDNERLSGVANGTASFTSLDKRQLMYMEEGKLCLTASRQEFAFSRRFIYVFDEDQLEILFNDGANSGQSYQRYSLGNDRHLSSSFQHICKADRYNGTYLIISSTRYKLETLINGPNKKIRIETHAYRT